MKPLAKDLTGFRERLKKSVIKAGEFSKRIEAEKRARRLKNLSDQSQEAEPVPSV